VGGRKADLIADEEEGSFHDLRIEGRCSRWATARDGASVARPLRSPVVLAALRLAHDLVVGRRARRHRHGGRRSRRLRRPNDGDDVFTARVRPVHDAVARGSSVSQEGFGDCGEDVHAAGGPVFYGRLVGASWFHARRVADRPFRVNGQRSPRHPIARMVFSGGHASATGPGSISSGRKPPGDATFPKQ
jgi:hypothetical protein